MLPSQTKHTPCMPLVFDMLPSILSECPRSWNEYGSWELGWMARFMQSLPLFINVEFNIYFNACQNFEYRGSQGGEVIIDLC